MTRWAVLRPSPCFHFHSCCSLWKSVMDENGGLKMSKWAVIYTVMPRFTTQSQNRGDLTGELDVSGRKTHRIFLSVGNTVRHFQSRNIEISQFNWGKSRKIGCLSNPTHLLLEWLDVSHHQTNTFAEIQNVGSLQVVYKYCHQFFDWLFQLKGAITRLFPHENSFFFYSNNIWMHKKSSQWTDTDSSDIT